MYSGKSGIKNLSGSIRVSEIPTVAQAMLSHWASSGLAEKCPLLNVGFAELDTLTKSAISTLNSEKSKSSLDDLDRALDEAWTALGTGLEGHFALQKGEKRRRRRLFSTCILDTAERVRLVLTLPVKRRRLQALSTSSKTTRRKQRLSFSAGLARLWKR